MDGRAQAVSRSWVSEEVLSLPLGQKKKRNVLRFWKRGMESNPRLRAGAGRMAGPLDHGRD